MTCYFAAKLTFIKVALSLKENVVYLNRSRRNICTTDTSDSLPRVFTTTLFLKLEGDLKRIARDSWRSLTCHFVLLSVFNLICFIGILWMERVNRK